MSTDLIASLKRPGKKLKPFSNIDRHFSQHIYHKRIPLWIIQAKPSMAVYRSHNYKKNRGSQKKLLCMAKTK